MTHGAQTRHPAVDERVIEPETPEFHVRRSPFRAITQYWNRSSSLLPPSKNGVTVVSFTHPTPQKDLGGITVGGSDRGEVMITAHLCKGCTLCIAACPKGVLIQGATLNRQGYQAVCYKGSGCTGCGICFYVCPEPGAITVRICEESKDTPAA